MNRRRYLEVVSATTVAVLAGCASDSDSEPDGTEPSDGGDTDTPDEPTDDGTATPRDPGATELETMAQDFLELLIAGSFDEAYEQVNPTFAQEIPKEDLAQAWEANIVPLGEFRRFTAVEYQGEQQGFDVVEAQAEFADGSATFTVQFDGQAVGGLFFQVDSWSVPEYVDRSAFTEDELSLAAPGDCELGATVTLPDSDGSVPGIVLVHGSGDQGRDQQVGPNRTFKELAWGLATRGVAVLRYDQRPVACDVDRTAATVDDLITDDALTALERLGEHDRVEDTFVAGHSLGGRVAPRIAARDGSLAGVVMLAPLAEPISDAIVRQTEYQLERNSNLTEQQREQRLSQVKALADRIRTLDIGDDELINLGGGERGRPFFRSLQEYDHVETAAALDIPRLIVQGERDFLVTTEDDLSIWAAELADDPAVQINRYESLNHRFQPGDGPSSQAEWFEVKPVAEQVVTDVATFIHNSAE